MTEEPEEEELVIDFDDDDDDDDFEVAVDDGDDVDDEIDSTRESAEAPHISAVMPVVDAPSGDVASRASDFFTVMDKFLRATRLYEGRGSLVENLLAETAKRAAQATDDGEVTVRVAPFGLLLGDEQVTAQGSRLAEALFKLFCDGIRELTFMPGIEAEEIRALTEILISDPRKGEDDFSTLLWKRELKHVHFYATDTLQTGVDMSGEGDQGLLAAAERSRVQSAAGVDAQEFVLSPDDLRMLKTDDRLGWVRECAAPMRVGQMNEATVQSMREAFDSPWDHQRFVQMAVRSTEDNPTEPSPLVLDMFDATVASGDAEGVARLLGAASSAARAGGLAAKNLRAALFDEGRIVSLARIYERHTALLAEVVQEGAREHPEALVALLNKLAPGDPRSGLLDALTDAGVDLTAYYRRCLNDENEEIVRHAIGALSKFGTDAATMAITEALGYTSTKVRRCALEALVGHYLPEARVAFARALGDPDRDNRLMALKVLATSQDRRVAGNILNRVQDTSFAQRDEQEQAELLRTLAAFKDARTVAYFEGLLTGVNLSRNAKVVARQMLAVDALRQIPGDESRQALARSAKKWGLPREVKDAVKRALSSHGGAS